MRVLDPARVDRRARGTDRAAESIGERLDEGEVLGPLDAAATGDDNVRLGYVELATRGLDQLLDHGTNRERQPIEGHDLNLDGVADVTPAAARRKLTMVVQLSESDAYSGGVLELMPDANIHAAETGRGTATVFPSFVLHRVTPVTAGERWSLTIWSHGPAFR